MTVAASTPTTDARGTAAQRARATLIGALGTALGHLPTPVVDGLCDAVGELWYRLAAGRAAVARANLAHVAGWLAANERGSARVRAAAGDPAVLEGLVRAAFRQCVRTYAETLRGAANARNTRRNLEIETPAAARAALAAPGPVVFVTLHLGSMSAAAIALSDRCSVPITSPMETIADPELHRILKRARESSGPRVVGLREAHRELRAVLARGEGVGLLADRDITGGGIPVILFGLPTTLPMGPAYLALEYAAPLHVAAVWRTPGGGYRARLATIPHPPAELPRRDRIVALLEAEARAFEDLVAVAPEQWWTVFFPIWDDVGPRSRGPR